MSKRPHILVVGGYVGLYTAPRLQKKLRQDEATGTVVARPPLAALQHRDRSQVLRRRSPGAAARPPSTWRQTATDELRAVLPILRRLPRHVDRITTAVEEGRLSVNVKLFSDERGRRSSPGSSTRCS